MFHLVYHHGLFLVGELLGHMFASRLFELLTGTVGNLLVGLAHLVGMRVDLSTTELALEGVKAFVQVVFLAGRTTGAGARLLLATSTEL